MPLAGGLQLQREVRTHALRLDQMSAPGPAQPVQHSLRGQRQPLPGPLGRGAGRGAGRRAGAGRARPGLARSTRSGHTCHRRLGDPWPLTGTRHSCTPAGGARGASDRRPGNAGHRQPRGQAQARQRFPLCGGRLREQDTAAGRNGCRPSEPLGWRALQRATWIPRGNRGARRRWPGVSGKSGRAARCDAVPP